MATIAAATWSTWIGGSVNALAIDSSGEELPDSEEDVVDAARERSRFEGVGSVRGTLR